MILFRTIINREIWFDPLNEMEIKCANGENKQMIETNQDKTQCL